MQLVSLECAVLAVGLPNNRMHDCLHCGQNPSVKHINSHTCVAPNMYHLSEQSHARHAILVEMQFMLSLCMLSLCTKLTGVQARLAACLCTQNMCILV